MSRAMFDVVSEVERAAREQLRAACPAPAQLLISGHDLQQCEPCSQRTIESSARELIGRDSLRNYSERSEPFDGVAAQAHTLTVGQRLRIFERVLHKVGQIESLSNFLYDSSRLVCDVEWHVTNG